MTNVIVRYGLVGLGLSKWVPNLMPDTKLLRWSKKKQVIQHRVGRKWLPTDIPADTNYLFRWGWSGRSGLPDAKTVNNAESIRLVNNKAAFRMKMMEADPALTTFTRTSWREWEADVDWDAKAIVRTAHHAQGRGFWYCDDVSDVTITCQRLEAQGQAYYINEYIPKIEECRVFVVQGRAVWVAEKTPGNPEDKAWNVAKGGRFDNVRWKEWNIEVVHTAIEAFNLTGLDFAGIDVMWTDFGQALVLEANSAPSQTSPYRQEGTAKAFNYIIKHGKEHIPIGDEGKYLRYIHPAIDDKAIIGEGE